MIDTVLIEDIKDFTLLYKAVNFMTGLTVTGYFIFPDLHKSDPFNFIELGDGIYASAKLELSNMEQSDLMQKYGLVIKENGTVKRFEIFSFSVKGSEI